MSSMKFNGFSQHEIQQIHSKTASGGVTKIDTRMRGKKVSDKSVHQNKQVQQITKAMAKPAPTPCNDSLDSINTIPSFHEALYFKPLVQSNSQDTNKLATSDRPVSSELQQEQSSNGNHNNGINNSNDSNNNKNNGKTDDNDGEHGRTSMFQGISLKDFENHRKMIEEQNRQKKELLAKALEQRSERTAAEAKKIAEVKEELNKLDAELAADVAILRKEIETATIQYANTQKMYQQIESQFLKAKLELHQSSEKKELLTEHLCTIISHNEDRKAKKLTELMEKVGISPTDDTNGNSAI